MPHASTGRYVLPSRRRGAFEASRHKSQDAVRIPLQGRMQRLFESRERSATSNSLTAFQLNLQTPPSQDQKPPHHVKLEGTGVRTRLPLPVVNIEHFSKRTHESLLPLSSTENAYQDGIDQANGLSSWAISPRISPWGRDNADSEPGAQHQSDISVAKESTWVHPKNIPHDKVALALGVSTNHQAYNSDNDIRNNITIVVERKRLYSPGSGNMVNLFAHRSCKVVADEKMRIPNKPESTYNKADLAADREDPSFPEYLYRKGTASPPGSYHHRLYGQISPLESAEEPRRSYSALSAMGTREKDMARYRRTMTGSPNISYSKKAEKDAKQLKQEQRASCLLAKLKKTIVKKKLAKRQLVAEQRIFNAEMKLRERVFKPLPRPKNSFLPVSVNPRLHPSHPAFAHFFNLSSNNSTHMVAPLAQQLSHERLSSYRFNSLQEDPPELKSEEQMFYRRVLLESRNAAEREHLSDQYRKRVLAFDKANAVLEKITKASNEIDKL